MRDTDVFGQLTIFLHCKLRLIMAAIELIWICDYSFGCNGIVFGYAISFISLFNWRRGGAKIRVSPHSPRLQFGRVGDRAPIDPIESTPMECHEIQNAIDLLQKIGHCVYEYAIATHTVISC